MSSDCLLRVAFSTRLPILPNSSNLSLPSPIHTGIGVVTTSDLYSSPVVSHTFPVPLQLVVLQMNSLQMILI